MPDFRFRLPSINDLTDTQQIAYYDRRSILITGGPGSGKTVVSIFRYLRQIGDNRNAQFFTFNRTLMSSIRGTLRQRADVLLPDLQEEDIEKIINSNIDSMFDWYGTNFHSMLSVETDQSIKGNFVTYINKRRHNKFSELFIDESQDLRPGIIAATFGLALKVTCGADRSQDIHGYYKGPADDEIYTLLQTQSITIRQELTQNFRNTREIFEFARKFVPEDRNVQNLDTSDLNPGENPDVRQGLNEQQQLGIILEIIKQYPNSNVGILVHTKFQINTIKKFLESKDYSCSKDATEENSFSYYYSGMNNEDKIVMESHLRTPFILTFESCKGLEFDIVVLPFFEWSDKALGGYKPNHYKPDLDANGNPKFWSTPNHYYVAATRARSQLFVLFNEKPKILNFWQKGNEVDLFGNITTTKL